MVSRGKSRKRRNMFAATSKWSYAALGLVGVFATVLVIVALTLNRAPVSGDVPTGDYAAAEVPVVEAKRTAVIIGDSYFAASAQHADPAVGDRVGDAMGWDYNNMSLGGTGYIATGYEGENKPTYVDRIRTAAATPPDILLIEGGGNDRNGHTAEEGAAALDSALGEAEGLMPATQIVVAGPLWTGSISGGDRWKEAYSSVLAAHPKVAWIDTVTAAWFPGEFLSDAADRMQFIGADLTHPNDAGAAMLSDKMAEALKAALPA